MKKITKELYILGFMFLAIVMGWNVYDYRNTLIGSSDVTAAASSRSASISVTVAQSITLTQTTGSTVDFGTLNPGTKVTGATGLTVSTNGVGMNITAGRQRAISNVTLASNAAPTVSANQINDVAGGLDVFNGISNCSTVSSHPATWTNGSSTGLGFTNYSFRGGNAKSTTCWGSGSTVTDANNRYIALQASASAASFISSSGFSTTTANASIGYALDVTSNQKATLYNGAVIFTATSNP